MNPTNPRKRHVRIQSTRMVLMAAMVCLLWAASVVNADDFTCFYKAPDDPIVCGGRGACIGPDLCRCDGTYIGSVCTHYGPTTCFGISSTDPAVCSGNGVCRSTDSCECQSGFEGAECQVRFDGTCFGVSTTDLGVCSGNGVCDGPDTCVCDRNHMGDECQVDLWKCFGLLNIDDTVCSSVGTCVARDQCECNPGYAGSDCQYGTSGNSGVCGDYHNSWPEVCSGRGQCQGGTCFCEYGFFGDDCEQAITCNGLDLFNKDACSGRGTCRATEDEYGKFTGSECVCDSGWTGPDCECTTDGWCTGDPREVRWNTADGDWHVERYWDVGELPRNAETVYVDNDGTARLTGRQVSVAAAFAGYTQNTPGRVFQSGGALSVGDDHVIGFHGTGAYTQSDGEHVVGDNLVLGWEAFGDGAYNLEGGSLSTGSDEFVGYNGTGGFAHSGGTHGVGAGLYVGYFAGSSGQYTLSGDGTLTVQGNLIVGHSGEGAFTQTGGTLDIASSLVIASQADSTGSYSLQGGSLTVDYHLVEDAGTGAFTLAGGILEVGGEITAGNFGFTGGRLSFDVFNGHLVNQGGTLAPGNSPGTSTVNGDYSQEAGSILEIEIGGTTEGQFDLLTVTGSAVLTGGTVHFVPYDGYRFENDIAPGASHAWEFLHADGGVTWSAADVAVTFAGCWIPVGFTYSVTVDGEGTGLLLEVTNEGTASYTLDYAIRVLKIMAGTSPVESACHDWNGNGFADLGDVIGILQDVAGLR